MIINTPVSLGELIDKISILRIKQKKIDNKNKLIYINEELFLLESTLSASIKDKKIEEYLKDLIKINSELWKIEDDIRDCERCKKFDQRFIDLARAVYFTNDQRSQIKLNINNLFGSKIVEVKSYEKY
jgi:hypothetical protein|tara:strand:- start:1338 stop:1721 length:384 start_codon:yes stop_codon:yes gene_type:complete